MELSIIILNYKTKGLLKQCLRGVVTGEVPIEHEVIVVDNHSQDGSAAMVREEFPTVRLINSPRNVGFGAGMNLGAKAATGTYLLMMNPDVAIFPLAIERLYKYIQAHPAVGLAAPKLINPDGTVQISAYRFPSWSIPILRRTPVGNLFLARRRLRQYLMTDWDHNTSRPVGWVLGACFLIPRELFQQLGGFDERFFLYVEDTDLCRRVWQAGREVHYVHSAEMVHYHKRASAERAGLNGLFAYPTRVHLRSWSYYFRKWHGQPKPPHSL